MKRYVFFLISLFAIAACSQKEESAPQPASAATPIETPAAAPTDAPATLPQITFDGQVYTLQNAQASQMETLNEYLLSGETFDNYTRMMAVQVFRIQLSLEEYMKTFEANLKGLPTPVQRLFTFADPAKATMGISFFLKGNGTIEYNLFNFRKNMDGEIEGVHFVARLVQDASEEGMAAQQAYFAQYAQQADWKKRIEETPFPGAYNSMQDAALNQSMEAAVALATPGLEPLQSGAVNTPTPGMPVTTETAWNKLETLNMAQDSYKAQHGAYSVHPADFQLMPSAQTPNMAEDGDFSYRFFAKSLVLSGRDTAKPVTWVLFYGVDAENPQQLNACYDSALPEVVSFAKQKNIPACKKK